MKIIGKRGSGKTTFPLAFLSSLIENKIITYDLQSCWNKTLFSVKNINELVSNEITQNKLLVFDEIQIVLKKYQRIAETWTR